VGRSESLSAQLSVGELKRIVGHANACIRPNASNPTLTSVLLEVREGTLRARATDLQVGVSARADAETKGEGGAGVSGERLQKIVGTLPVEAQIKIQIKDNKIFIRCGKSKCQLAALAPGDFPLFPEVPGGVSAVSFEAKPLVGGLKWVKHAMMDDVHRPTLSGALVSVAGHDVTIVTCDSRRIAKAQWYQKVKSDVVVFLPARAVTLLQKFAVSEDEMQFHVEGSYAFFWSATVGYHAKLNDGKGIDLGAVIPTGDTQTMVAVERVLFADAVKRLRAIEDHVIKCVYSKGKLVLEVENRDGEATVELDAKVYGKSGGLCLAGPYLSDLLGVICDETVRMHVWDSLKPVMLNGESDTQCYGILMPMTDR